MERLCDEVIQLIFYELVDPGPLTLASNRFYRFSKDPYVRAHYFLSHYGPTEAMFHALGRGKVITERVLDILLASGAHVSRYLIQVSIHHYFYAQSHFIKTPWVRNVSLAVFTHFLKMAERMYGDVPRAKGEDDGSIFTRFLKESRLPSTLKSVTWESIQEILEVYKFIPFSNKDPLMAQFPLVLAIEPRLLPYAVQNGFSLDPKYRDFVFRKMFERPASSSETLPEEIARNVRELCKLDSTMFLSRTVAAEVCMEAKTNVSGYNALKVLDKSGDLRFELAGLIEDLIKSFLRTRSICWTTSIETIRYLYSDFPSSNPTVRLVMLITFFNTYENNAHNAPSVIHGKLEAFGLTPISKKDVFSILVNPFVDKYQALLDYARWELSGKDDGAKGLAMPEFKELIGDIVSRCLEVSCKGKLLKKLQEGFGFVSAAVVQIALEKHQISLAGLPASDNDDACAGFEAKLCRDYAKHILAGDDDDKIEGKQFDSPGELPEDAQEKELSEDVAFIDLGDISQESLTTMIRHDEVSPVRSRRRMQYPSGLWMDSSGKLPYPHDPLPVGRWIKNEFGPRNRVTAVFMTHAVINDNSSILQYYLLHSGDGYQLSNASQVPVTLKHFQILAHLGKAPNFYLYHKIEDGAEFFFDEEDYIRADERPGKVHKVVKAEITSTILPPPNLFPRQDSALTTTTKKRKRPRRTATSITSYAVPDSDDESIALDGNLIRRPRPLESNMQKWIYHLTELLKLEQRKFKAKKKALERLAEPGTKPKVAKNDFFKSLSVNLRNLRRLEDEKRIALYGPEALHPVYSEDDDDDDYRQTSRTKRRRPS